MHVNFKEILKFYFKTLILQEPKKLNSNEIAEYCFLEENNNQIILTHYWFRQILWPLSLLFIYCGFFLYQGITDPNFFAIDYSADRNFKSLLAVAIILLLILAWSTIALIGRTTLILTADKFLQQEKPFKFLGFACQSLEIKNFEILTKYRQDPDNSEVFVFVILVALNGEQKKLLTFKSTDESISVCDKLNVFLLKVRSR